MELTLTNGGICLIDDEDYEKIKHLGWHINSMNYVCSGGGNGTMERNYLHRFIMKPKRNEVVDHINGNKLDNRKCNLRVTSQGKNTSSRTKNNKNNTSGYRGVYWHKAGNKWMASIEFNRKQIYLGLYDTKTEAARAFNEKARELFGDYCGKLNDV